MKIKLYNTKTTLTLSILMLLMMTATFSKKKQKNLKMRKLNTKTQNLTTLKTITMMAMLNLLVFILHKNDTMLKMLKWKKDFKMKFKLSLFIDTKFIFFLSAALIVTWSMMEFSVYYMSKDPFKNKFSRLLIIFLLNMLILTSSKNMFLFFMGWEGVGFLSFLLMGWWFSRNNAKKAALQAMMYNRMGDIGMMLLISTILMKTKGWELSNMKFLKKSKPKWTKMILFSSLVAAMGKSAQFSLHPWLPAAMEGPTPVSALLHSSTMVVAGMFLLIRMTKMSSKTTFLTTCSMMGATTAIFAATSAFRQHDMKKMMAYSTTSQLGLMMLALGLGFPKMALFHICTHAFFKAMLFLCSGSIIHSHKKEQDLRKISKMKKTLPMTSACLFLGSMALMGIPFLSGFFSKDLILESMMKTPSKMLFFSLAKSATFLTAAYSFRMMTLSFNKNSKNPSMKPYKEKATSQHKPLMRLALGTVMAGWLLSNWLFNTPPLFPTEMMKKTPLMVTLSGALMAISMLASTKSNFGVYFFTKTWFFSKTAHSTTSKISAKTALMLSTRTLDRGWKELMGGQGMFSIKKKMSQEMSTTQTSYMKQYLLSITLIILSIMTMMKM